MILSEPNKRGGTTMDRDKLDSTPHFSAPLLPHLGKLELDNRISIQCIYAGCGVNNDGWPPRPVL